MTDELSRIARLEEHVKSLDQRVSDLSALAITVATLNERVSHFGLDFADFRKLINQRDEDAEKERRQTIRWMIGLTVTIICALMGALTLVITSGSHP
jgi:Tfp pilus assembly protein PilN